LIYHKSVSLGLCQVHAEAKGYLCPHLFI